MESVISPAGSESVKPSTLAKRPASLDGLTIGEVWNQDFKGDIMFPIYRELLRERFPGVKIVPFNEFPVASLKGTPKFQREVLDQITAKARAAGCDALITGNGG